VRLGQKKDVNLHIVAAGIERFWRSEDEAVISRGKYSFPGDIRSWGILTRKEFLHQASLTGACPSDRDANNTDEEMSRKRVGFKQQVEYIFDGKSFLNDSNIDVDYIDDVDESDDVATAMEDGGKIDGKKPLESKRKTEEKEQNIESRKREALNEGDLFSLTFPELEDSDLSNPFVARNGVDEDERAKVNEMWKPHLQKLQVIIAEQFKAIFKGK
jgi:nucleoside 2-deoxyribosyltransferase